MKISWTTALWVLAMVGCEVTGTVDVGLDAAGTDAALDTGRDSPALDAGPGDAGAGDAMDDDGGAATDASDDASEPDAGDSDSGEPDAGEPDAPAPMLPSFDVEGAAVLRDVSGAFGSAIAISPDGAFLAVGNPQGGSGSNGVVRIYTRGSTGWTLAETLGLAGRRSFGTSVAFAPSSDVLAVGDPSGGDYNDGTVDLFALDGASFEAAPYQTLEPRSGDLYATAIAFSPDGASLAVSDPGYRVVLIYASTTGTSFEAMPAQTLSEPPPAPRGRFGIALVFSPDGSELLIADDLTGDGMVQTFPFAGGVVTTTPTATLLGPPDTSEQFATALAFNADGTVLAVGSPYDPEGGVLLLYSHPGATEPFDTLTRAGSNSFGRGVAFAPDGSELVVGDRMAGTSNEGAVYVAPAR